MEIKETPNTESQDIDAKFSALKEEFSGKTASVEDKLEQINQRLQNMQLLNTQPSPKAEPVKSERPDPILDPEAYDRYMENKINGQLNARFESQQRQQTELAHLVNQFPELSDSSSELNKAAINKYNKLSAHDKMSPSAYKLVVQEAALELGVLPASKRKQLKDNEDSGVDLPVTRSKPLTPNNTKSGKSQKIDQATLEFAKMLGHNVNDPKYIERLTKAASRQEWGRSKTQADY